MATPSSASTSERIVCIEFGSFSTPHTAADEIAALLWQFMKTLK
jgi:hypothetical protein